MTKQIEETEYSDTSGLYAQVVDSLPIPIFCKRADGIIKACNTAFTRIAGISKAEIIGKKLIDIFPFEQADVLLFKDSDTLNNGSDQFYETRLKYADGDLRDVIINKAAMRRNGTEISGIVSSIIDITERKKAQNKLERAEEEKRIAATMLQKIRAGIVIVDEELKIIESNIGFARMFGEENEELFETIPGLHGAELDMLVPEVIVNMFRSIIDSGESRLERDIRFQNRLFSINVMTIHRNKIAGAIIRDLSAPMLERAEIIERARQVNRKNMKTVQEIAFLLGENAAQTEELLNSIIESQKYDVDDNE
ncbi:PAS domain-containing protein [Roseimarinus sediminis]|jgi:PAS domain S-box-containing protein|uniref:PAS domain-containing protein n=1 Tax=Roseimarinus sediminis TaxID=1610899 RepID=UPI003D1D82A0